MVPVGPAFHPDSAYSFCQQQCDFGPRTMNSSAHDLCGQWIIRKFEQYGMTVSTQQMVLKGYDGTPLKSMNIIASYLPEQTTRILLCAHWDSRPWADNDPDEANHPHDADTSDSRALGDQYWAKNPHKENYEARFGILLDMVGGEGAQFYKEGISKQFAPAIVEKVWQAAQIVGYGSFFPSKDGTGVTDDHVPVNQYMKIPTIDIIPYYPECEQSSFGPTWHTLDDNMSHISKHTLQAVGQTIIQVLFSEK